MSTFLALKHVRRRALQSGVTVLGVAVGVMVLIVALSLTNGFIDELISSTLEATPHVQLSSLTGNVTMPYDLDVFEAILNHPEVMAVSPYLQNEALISRRADRTRGISGTKGFTRIVGIDPELERQVLDLEVLNELDLGSEQGVVLGRSLAFAQLGVLPGDTVYLLDIGSSAKPFTVLDLFQVGNELIDGAVSYMSIPQLQAYMGLDDEISGYHVRVKDPQEAQRVGMELALAYNLRAVSWQNYFSGLVNQLRLQKALISAVVFLIVLVAAMGIANILIVTIAEKTEEIAILRALGSSRRRILSTFTLEGFMLGASGTLLGVMLGLLICLYFTLKPFPLPGDLYFITQLPVQLQLWDFVWVCAVSLLTSVIAGLIPAYRASSIEPARILR